MRFLRRRDHPPLTRDTGEVIDVFHGETFIPFASPDLRDRQHEILLGVKNSQKAITLEGIGRLTVKQEPIVETAAPA